MSYIDPNRPAWRVLAVSGFYGPDDHLYELDATLYFDGEPNEELEPLNEAARVKMQAYLEKLDAFGREAAAKAGKQFAGRPRDLSGGIELATAVARAETAVMGHLNKDRQTQGIEKIDVQDVIPETGSITPRGKRGRPPGTVKTAGPSAIAV